MTRTESPPARGTALSIGPRDVVRSVAGLSAVVLLIAVGLPYFLDTSWAEIGAQLAQVRPGPAVLMGVLMLAALVSYTWVLTGSLPGLTHLQGLKVNAVSSLVGSVLPLGAAVGLAAHVLMFRSWGFRPGAISVSLLVSAVWNFLARIALPVVGCLVLLAGPVDAPRVVVQGALLAGTVGTAVLAVVWLTISSDTAAGWVVRVVGGTARRFGRGEDRLRRLERLVHDQRRDVEQVVRAGGRAMTLGMAGQFVLLFGLYWCAARSVGLDLPLAALLCAYTFRQLLTTVAITPAGLGVTEVGTAGLLVALGGSPGAASAAALVYAIYAHLVVVPFGVLALVGWWTGPGRSVVARPPVSA